MKSSRVVFVPQINIALRSALQTFVPGPRRKLHPARERRPPTEVMFLVFCDRTTKWREADTAKVQVDGLVPPIVALWRS
jgi:hypothetical protein